MNYLLNFDSENTYEKCVREELKSIFERKLNCTPPLIASKNDSICNKRFDLTNNEGNKIIIFFVTNYLNFESSHCKKPCTQTTYEVHSNTKAEDNEMIIKLTFDPVVHITRSKYSTTVIDAITSLGGSVRNF